MLGNIASGVMFGVREEDDGSGDIYEIYVKFGDGTTLVIKEGDGGVAETF